VPAFRTIGGDRADAGLTNMETTMTDVNQGRIRVQRLSAVVALVFGLMTLGAGVSVLAGRDPGYLVYRPLLLFNTCMGLGYVAAGMLAWRRAIAGRIASLLIVGLNALVLARVLYLYRVGGVVALDSVRAMFLRTGVWLALFLLLWWAGSRRHAA
jgi:hypothetical protein